MRQETQKIAEAWWLGHSANAARTTTDGTTVYLHGNAIAWRGDGGYYFTLAGWATVTTRERLNGILNVMGAPQAGFSQRKGLQYFTDLKGEEREIDSDDVVFIGR